MTDMTENLLQDPTERDPRSAPFGIFTGGSFVLDSVRVFCWFQSLDLLADYLLTSMPELYDFDEEYKAEYQQRMAPLVQQMRRDGFTEALREQLNQTVKDVYIIEWWGLFDELVENETEFARGISSGFLDDNEAERPIQPEELDDFVEHLKTCGV